MINCTKYNYKLYNLSVLSDFPLPEGEVIEITDNIDVTIRLGEVPFYIKEEVSHGNKRGYSKDKIWMYIKNVAYYHITNGHTILVEPIEGITFERIRAFLLGFAFGMLFRQRNIVAIHGGSIVVNGKAVVLAGSSGAGKSTLTTAYRLKGNTFIGDEVAIIKEEDSLIKAIPTHPSQKLCKDTVEKLNYDLSDSSIDLEKRHSLKVLDNFLEEPIELGAFIELTIKESGDVTLEEIKGPEKIERFFSHTYMKAVAKNIGMDKEYFHQCIRILSKVPVYKLTRPFGEFTVERQMELINERL